MSERERRRQDPDHDISGAEKTLAGPCEQHFRPPNNHLRTLRWCFSARKCCSENSCRANLALKSTPHVWNRTWCAKNRRTSRHGMFSDRSGTQGHIIELPPRPPGRWIARGGSPKSTSSPARPSAVSRKPGPSPPPAAGPGTKPASSAAHSSLGPRKPSSSAAHVFDGGARHVSS